MRRKMYIYKCMLNVYKNQQNRQTGSRNLMGPKTLPTIWDTYMTLVTEYQISAINSYWEKCEKKYIGRTDRGITVYPPPSSGCGGIIRYLDFYFSNLSSISWLLNILRLKAWTGITNWSVSTEYLCYTICFFLSFRPCQSGIDFFRLK
jgi:hypothetical protein